MSFKLTEEQLMIQSMVRDLAREEFAPRAMERDQKKLFPADKLKKLAELGLMGMMVPPEYGGSGADAVPAQPACSTTHAPRRRIVF